jgi:hypothetical protein
VLDFLLATLALAALFLVAGAVGCG